MTEQMRFCIKDLIVDIRCARRDGMEAYAGNCEVELRRVWAMRHGGTFNRYGQPVRPTIAGELGPR